MDDLTLQKLGKRIRLYRKSCGMSLEDLAAKIHKSKASISKYELGQIAMDVLTLTEIASALGVVPFQLLEVKPRNPVSSASINHPFGKTDQLYLYHLANKTVFSSMLKFGPTDQSGQINVTLYYKVDNPQHIEQCENIYHGYMYNHDMVISFFLRNYNYAVENILLNVAIPMHNTEYMTGMICGLDRSLSPTARKIILTKTPIEKSDIGVLRLSEETVKAVKRNNCLTIKSE